MEAKVLPWVQVIHTMIPVLDVMLNCDYPLSFSGYGDGRDHGNGDGANQYQSIAHWKGDGIGNANIHRSVGGNGSSLVNKDGNGTVTRQ